MSKRIQGIVRWFNSRRGIGFIKPEENDTYTRDIFVHYTGIDMEGYKVIKADDRVEFDVVTDESKNKRGPIAINLKVISSSEPQE